MTFSRIKLLILLVSIILSNSLLANDLSPRVFYSYESNGSDYLSSVGTGITFKQHGTNLGIQFNTSLGHAEVLAEDGYLEEYFSWEASAKVGYFSDISLYVEAGFDVSEMIFHDLRHDDDDNRYYDNSGYYNDNGFYNDEYEDDIDAFFGVGAGIRVGAIQFDAIIRVREIDSTYWEAESDTFSGIQISVNF